MAGTPKRIAVEAERGRSERTPWLVLWSVTGIVGVFVCVILFAALLVYYLV